MNRFKEAVAKLKKESQQRKVLKALDHNWVESQMNELGITRNDLIQDLMIDKSSLSLFLNNKRKMNKSVKAAFFYYLAYKRLQKEKM
jgi:hypothetical protein